MQRNRLTSTDKYPGQSNKCEVVRALQANDLRTYLCWVPHCRAVEHVRRLTSPCGDQNVVFWMLSSRRSPEEPLLGPASPGRFPSSYNLERKSFAPNFGRCFDGAIPQSGRACAFSLKACRTRGCLDLETRVSVRIRARILRVVGRACVFIDHPLLAGKAWQRDRSIGKGSLSLNGGDFDLSKLHRKTAMIVRQASYACRWQP